MGARGGHRRANAPRQHSVSSVLIAPETVARNVATGAVAARRDPAVPAVGSAPTEAGARAVAAPVPAGTGPAVGIPAIGFSEIDELGALDQGNVFERGLHRIRCGDRG